MLSFTINTLLFYVSICARVTLLLAFFLVSSSKLAANPSHSDCSHEKAAPVRVCTTAHTYEWMKDEQTLSFDKGQMHSDTMQLVQQFFLDLHEERAALDQERKEIPLAHDLCNARVGIWLSIPPAAPSAAAVRLVVQQQNSQEQIGPHFVAFLPWPDSPWILTHENIAILPPASYPASYGYSLGTMLLSLRDPALKLATDHFLAQYDLRPLEALNHSWFLYQGPAFRESATLASLKADILFPVFLLQAELQPIFEWIADRQEAFSFIWHCPSHGST